MGNEHELEFLLDFDGTRFLFEEGYWVKIDVRRVEPGPGRPHGLSYGLTLHHPEGQRLLGFDNAHAISARGGRSGTEQAPHDHWHRTELDPGRPYEFRFAVDLMEDFLNEVERVLRDEGVSAVMRQESRRDDRSGH